MHFESGGIDGRFGEVNLLDHPQAFLHEFGLVLFLGEVVQGVLPLALLVLELVWQGGFNVTHVHQFGFVLLVGLDGLYV